MAVIAGGKDAREHFALDDGYRNLNHGSYGTYPREVRSVYIDYIDKSERRPDAFVRYDYRTRLLDESRATLATYLNVPAETCVYVPNATTGVETVLRNLVYSPGDVIIGLSTMYPAFANILTYLRETTPLQTKEVEFTLPVSHDRICALFEQAITEAHAAGQRPILALYETVSTCPGVRMPFERLTEICKMHNILSCIDGAHGVGQMPLDLSALNPDFFTSNAHKWLYVPRPCAVLYVPKRNQHLLRTTLPTSFCMYNGFVGNFAYVGTLNDAPYLCVQAALDWRKRVTWAGMQGEEAVMGYILELARNGGQIVADLLQTEVLESEKGELGNCATAVVRLPVDVVEPSAETEGEAGKAICAWVQKVMTLEHETAVVAFYYAEQCWVQLSAQVYLTLDDFGVAGSMLLETCRRAEKGDWK